MRGIYLHIPFCLRKCSYCDFYSVEAEAAAMKEFRDLLVRETDLLRDRFPEDAAAPADTVYFGGGTPTVLPPEALCGLLAATRDRFPVEPGAEITVEANPGTVTAEGLRALVLGGFTRISIGVQSFTPATLRTLGRIHGVEEVGRTYREARSAGFSSLGIDLIFG
ncbi:MAG: radical SAM protein, partial [Candidatus Deferrimicrobiaceae bacterium]